MLSKAQRKQHDRMLLENTTRCQAEPLIDNDGGLHTVQLSLPLDESSRTLYKPQKCYVCKAHFTDVHHFYHRLCPHCAEKNYAYRSQTADLTERVALVTGGRIKIGFEIALKLLRAGAIVLVTTRFAQNAIQRYHQQADFADWAHRLRIYPLDLKNIDAIEAFTDYLSAHYASLDILINNAAQTLRKPDTFYQHMAQQERLFCQKEQQLLGHFADSTLLTALANHALSAENRALTLHTPTDEFNEPIDFRAKNCWLTRLHEVDTLTFLEAQIINATAPFLLNSRLKPLMQKSSFAKRFIINVSAMEGQFNRENKTDKHPHTNMAKASLNMMTRTTGKDYAKDGIYMNSVDTGWVTQENPHPVRQRARLKGMVPPLDCIDGASRVLAPIFDAIAGAEPVFGQFIKDYQVAEW